MRRGEDARAMAGTKALPSRFEEAGTAVPGTHVRVHRHEAAPNVGTLGEERVIKVEDQNPGNPHVIAVRGTKTASS